MTWFKVDDKLHSHKKAARAGEAMALWVVAGSWSADQLTDGFVPDYIAERLIPDGREMADRLVKAGLWLEDAEDGDEGWRFHGWGDYQPTRADVESSRERERDKKRNQRRNQTGQFEASPSESPDVSPGDSDGTPRGSLSVVTPSRPDPSRPVPTEKKTAPRKRATQLPDGWEPTDDHRELAMTLGVDVGRETEQFRDHHAAKGSTFKDWNRAFNTWLRNAQSWSPKKPDQQTRPQQVSL